MVYLKHLIQIQMEICSANVDQLMFLLKKLKKYMDLKTY